MPPLVRKASAIAFQEITVCPAEDQQSEWFDTAWRRAGPGSSGRCGIPVPRIQEKNTSYCEVEIVMSPYHAVASPPVLSVSVMTAMAPISRGSSAKSIR